MPLIATPKRRNTPNENKRQHLIDRAAFSFKTLGSIGAGAPYRQLKRKSSSDSIFFPANAPNKRSTLREDAR